MKNGLIITHDPEHVPSIRFNTLPGFEFTDENTRIQADLECLLQALINIRDEVVKNKISDRYDINRYLRAKIDEPTGGTKEITGG